MMTIQKPKRTWQKKKDYMRKKTIRGLRRKGKRILQSFDDGTDDKKYYLYDTSERLHDSNAIIEYPEAKDGPVITLQGSYPSIQEYYLGRKWRGGASPFGTIQNMQDFLTDRDFARFANATRAYGNGEGISGFWNGLTDNPDYTGAMEDPGTAFLMKPSRQAEFLNKLGYIEDARPIGRNMIKGPYEALYNYTGKYIPTYRKGQDDEQPENVESISDTDIPEGVSKQKSPEDSAERSLVHAGYYPTGYFKSKEGDKYYQMDIDLNDYGQHETSDAGGAKSAYKQDARSTIANLYDYFGNPFVQRSGLRKLAGKPSHDNGKDCFDNGVDNNIRKQIEKDFPSSKAFGTILPDYTIVADPTFTRDKTGAGEIEYFNEPEITYANGYRKANPVKGPSLVYNPNSQTEEDIKLDLLHHYREYDPVYQDLLKDYTNTQDPGQILYNSELGEYFRNLPKEQQTNENWNKLVKENLNGQYMVQGIDGSLRGLTASDKLRSSGRYPSRIVYEQENLNTNAARKAYQNIVDYLTSERLPEVIVKPGYNNSQYFHNSGKDIHIKKANRGKFTEAANEHNMGVQEFARQVLSAPKGKYSSTLRKRANFARNFAH